MIAGAYVIPFPDYLADPAPEPSLSRSTIIDILDCPARAWHNHPKLNPQPPEQENSTAFDIGSACHSLLLEGGDAIFVVEGFDDWRKKEAQQARDAARSVGKVPLLEKQYAEVCMMSAATNSAIMDCTELGIKDLRADGDAELSYIWSEGATWMRCRPDWISKDRKVCLDLKTTGKSADPEQFGRHIADMGYDVQESLYRRGIKAVEGIDPAFIFVVIEDEPPYLCSFVSLSSEFQDMGDQKVKKGIKLWRECMTTGQWPAYQKRVYCVDAPAWSLTSWEMQKWSGGEE